MLGSLTCISQKPTWLGVATGVGRIGNSAPLQTLHGYADLCYTDPQTPSYDCQIVKAPIYLGPSG